MVHDLNSKQSINHSTTFFAKSKKPYFWGVLGQYPQNEIFPKNLAPSVFYPSDTLTSREVSEKSWRPFSRKHVYLMTY